MSANERIEKAIAAVKTGDKTTAFKELSLAVREEPKNIRAWFLLSQVVEKPEQAIFCLKKVMEIDPENQRAVQRLQQLESAARPAVSPQKDDKETTEQGKDKPSWILGGLVFVAVIAIIGFAGYYYYYGPCGLSSLSDAAIKMDAAMTRFSDAEGTAGQTGRISLSGPIGRMQDIHREFDTVDVPACLIQAKALYSDGMSSTIDAYLTFMGKGSDASVQLSFDQAQDRFRDANAEVLRIKKCAPICPEK